MKLICTLICSLGLASAKHIIFEDNNYEHEVDFGMPHIVESRLKTGVSELGNEPPKKFGPAAQEVLAAYAQVASQLPSYIKEGRHYWPTEDSLTKQLGLGGTTFLIDEVVRYERRRALAAARSASCKLHRRCELKKRRAAFDRVLTDRQAAVPGTNCDVVFAGCKNYY